MWRVFVFPSCNEVGLEIIHALAKSNKIALFGGSSHNIEHDPSRLLLEHHIVCPGHEEDDFEPRFKAILEELDIDLVFPAWDPLVARFSTWDMPGVRFITPTPEIAQLLLSKSETYTRLANAVPVPRVYADGEETFPAFAKPDSGSGSKGAMMVEDADDLKVARNRGLLVTEFLPGAEYTVDCMGSADGSLLVANVRLRGLVNRGIALGTKGGAHPVIEAHCEAIARELRIPGPWLAQFREDAEGKPTLLEVNGRVAGSMGLTRHAGVNIPLMSVFQAMGHKVRVPNLFQGTLVNRHLLSVVDARPFHWVIWDLDDTLIRKDGKPDPDALCYLYDCCNRGIKQILLSKNPDTPGAMKAAHIPDVFVEVCQTNDKIAALKRLLEVHAIGHDDCIIVNDSYAETFAIQEQFPGLRTVTPDVLSVLGREGVR